MHTPRGVLLGRHTTRYPSLVRALRCTRLNDAKRKGTWETRPSLERMSIDHTVVLLPALGDTEAQTGGAASCGERGSSGADADIGVRGSTPVILEEPALAVLDALPDALFIRSCSSDAAGEAWSPSSSPPLMVTGWRV